MRLWNNIRQSNKPLSIQFYAGGKMTQILITPAEVQQTARDIKLKKQEILASIDKGQSVMNNLKGGFKGNLATQIFLRWDELLPRLRQANETLEEAGDLLRKAGDAFQQVDDTKL
jgi:WXG100 family type VII secretion target